MESFNNDDKILNVMASQNYLQITARFRWGRWGKVAKKGLEEFLRILHTEKSGVQLEELINGEDISFVGTVNISDLEKHEKKPFGTIGEVRALIAGPMDYLDACRTAVMSNDDVVDSELETFEGSRYEFTVEVRYEETLDLVDDLIGSIAEEESCKVKKEQFWYGRNSRHGYLKLFKEQPLIIDRYRMNYKMEGGILQVAKLQRRIMDSIKKQIFSRLPEDYDKVIEQALEYY